jgi:hypothetical protein
MKIRSLCSEPIPRHARLVGDLQMKPTFRMRGPRRPVLGAKAAPARAARNGCARSGPLERYANVSTMTAGMEASIGDRVVHLSCAGSCLCRLQSSAAEPVPRGAPSPSRYGRLRTASVF